VVQQIAEWKQCGLSAQVAINLSAKDLSRQQLLNDVVQALDEACLERNVVAFEITESEIMQNPDEAIALLNHFRALGFDLAIDDFGTGYSSLSQLKNMPVTELKIDKSFVLKLNELVDDQIIVKSTIDLAHEFGLKVVAEGVENQESLELLTRWGCDWIQGYYISKPIPAKDVLDWHQTQQAHQKSALL
ncbi:MAG: EAL domain-containing protein, partial [Pseudomonadales bacterium]|nr:EAL domain-containing protein [Pseudomonadales bacterium]